MTCNPPNDPADDTAAIQLCKAICSAPTTDRIPLVHARYGCNCVVVSEHINNREETPEILLKGLAAYAETQSRHDLAVMAREAAARIKKSLSQYTGRE